MNIRTHELLMALLLAACSGGSSGAIDVGADHDHQHEEAPPATNRVDVPPSVRRNLGLSFTPVEVRVVEDTLRIPGAFELAPHARREYRTLLPARIELLVEQYQVVTPGMPLFRYQSPMWPELLHEILTGEQAMATAEAEIALAAAREAEGAQLAADLEHRIQQLAALEQRRADLEQELVTLRSALPRLRAERVLAETRLENARSTREHALHRASAAVGLSEESLLEDVPHGDGFRPRYATLDWIEVHASDPGQVEAIAVSSGAFVEEASPVLQTVDTTKIRFRALALQADLERLEGARGVRVAPASVDGPALEARLSIALEAHPEERTIEVLAQVSEAASWARAGVTAFLEVVVAGGGRKSFAVPAQAVVQDGLTKVFFRRDPQDPDKVIRTEADLGVSDGAWVVLESGVGPGDEVVLEGVYELKLATQQGGGPQAGGHFHADGSFHEDH